MHSLAMEFIRAGVYHGLPMPCILTSGEALTPFYIRMQEILSDPAADETIERFKESPWAMARYLRRNRSPGFQACISAATEAARPYLSNDSAISGGQRRDWLFSIPVAERLDLPHICLYKDGREPYIIGGDRKRYNAVHIVDVISKASSILRSKGGWIRMLEDAGHKVRIVVSAFDRQQGGAERLQGEGLEVISLVCLEDILSRLGDVWDFRSYMKDDEEWTRQYLRTGYAYRTKYDDDRYDRFRERYGKLLNSIRLS